MFHIANKIYLEVDYKVTADTDAIIISKQFGEHPFVGIGEVTIENFPTYEKAVEAYETEENLWNSLLTKKDKFTIFLEEELLFDVTASYLRCLFPKAKNEDLYKIFDSKNESELMSNLMANITPTGYVDVKEAFMKALENASKIDVFKNLDKKDVSFEYLLLNYHDPEIKKEAISRYRSLADKNFTAVVSGIRSSLLKLGPNVNRLFGEKKSLDLGSTLDYIRVHQDLNWILDPDTFSNNALFKQKYPYELIERLYKEVSFIERDNFFKTMGLSEEEYRAKLDTLTKYTLEMIRHCYENDYEVIFEEMVKSSTTMKWFSIGQLPKFNYELVVWTLDKIATNNRTLLQPYSF